MRWGIGNPSDRAVTLLQAAAEEEDFEATKGYLDYLGTRFKELSNATGASVEIMRSEAVHYAARYRATLVLYGCNGKTEARLTAARELTGFAGPDKPEVREAVKSRLDDELLGALALVRIYRREGGKDRTAITWLEKMEKHLRDTKWKNHNDETAATKIDQQERELAKRIAARRTWAMGVWRHEARVG
ncbi:MAG: hypothetical protein Q8J74_13250 [Candidatus Didemnitutus sp.]|nr:hypothetical protein [Candidatus Didemnitutus sp.]